jgi:WD40 repeat protein
VTGEQTGRLRLWQFNNHQFSESSVQYLDSPVTHVSFNQTGDRLLMTTRKGMIFASDFSTANIIEAIPGANAAWLNTDTQIIVAEPRYARLLVYDIVAQDAPVAIFDFHKFSQSAAMAVSGSQIISGYDDGSVVMLDIAAGRHQTLALHKTPVQALQYDPSGRFFMSGAGENRIKIVNAKVEAEIEESGNLFQDFDGTAAQKGICQFAIANQTIAACGYSSTIRVWHVADPRRLFTQNYR